MTTVTFTESVTLSPFELAVALMYAMPTETPVTKPFESTAAAGLVDCHVIEGEGDSGVPFASVVRTENCELSPTVSSRGVREPPADETTTFGLELTAVAPPPHPIPSVQTATMSKRD
jgi:hypothetical protein